MMLTRCSPRRVSLLATVIALGSVATLLGVPGAATTYAVTTPPPPACPVGTVAVLYPGPAPRPDQPGTTMPDGTPAIQICQPAPFPAPHVAPEHVVGGPRLAEPGVVTDLSAGIPAPPPMPHVSYVLADFDTGEILAAKAAHAWLRPASTIKALTALTAMPALDPALVVTATEEDSSADGSRVGLVPGNDYPIADLFTGLVLVSGNDTAYAIARAYGGRDRLLADMNARAEALGAFDTVAVDPSGLDAVGQRSSSYDLALIGRAVMALPEYQRLATLPVATFPGATRTVAPSAPGAPSTTVVGPYQIANSNRLLGTYPGLIGVKNGFTRAAGNTYIVAVRTGSRTLLLAEMGSPVRQLDPTRALLDWAGRYADQARPVGQLVEPGAAVRPVEFGGPARATVPTATTATTPTATATAILSAAAPSGTPATPPGSATDPTEHSTTWPSAGERVTIARVAGLAGLVLILAALGWRLRRGRGSRGSFEP